MQLFLPQYPCGYLFRSTNHTYICLSDLMLVPPPSCTMGAHLPHAAHTLDDLDEDSGSVSERFREDLQQHTLVVPVYQNAQLLNLPKAGQKPVAGKNETELPTVAPKQSGELKKRVAKRGRRGRIEKILY